MRGLAHLGVVKVLSEAGIRPAVITGTSAGSLIGAMLAVGMDWDEIASLARGTFWPKLLHGETLERFCTEHLPATFAGLKLPFAALATQLPEKQAVAITTGDLASAISASCALRGIRQPVQREAAASPAFCHRKRAGRWVRTSLSAPMFGKSARYCAA